MRRAIVPLAIGLSLVTGVVLNQTRLLLFAPVESFQPPRSAAHAGVARGFYLAVNTAVATGDTRDLAAIVDPGFVDHSPGPGLTPDLSGLLASIQSVRTVAPDLRLHVAELTVGDGRVAARVTVDGAAAASFVSAPLANQRLWAAIEVFRIAGGRIVERWSDAAASATFDLLLDVEAPVDVPVTVAIAVEQWTYQRGASRTWETNGGFAVLHLTSGSVRIDRDAGNPITLDPGGAVVIPARSRFTVRNEGDDDASLLVVRAVSAEEWSTPMNRVGGAAASPVEHRRLASDPAVTLPAGRLRMTIGRAILALGATLPAHPVALVEAAVMEKGSALVSANTGVWLTKWPNAAPRFDSAGTQEIEGGVAVEGGAVAGYAAVDSDPLSLLLVSIAPRGDA